MKRNILYPYCSGINGIISEFGRFEFSDYNKVRKLILVNIVRLIDIGDGTIFFVPRNNLEILD